MLQPATLLEYDTAVPPVSVMVVDDHPLAREGIRVMVEMVAHIHLVGEASTGEEALALAPHLGPTVALVDYKLPGIDGIETVRRLKDAFPDLGAIIMTSCDDHSLVIDAIQAGASGFLVKDASRALLVHSIQAVAHGGSLIKTELLRRALRGAVPVAAPSRLPPPQSPLLELLTERERAILRLLAEGKTNKAIATTLGFAEITVKKHVQDVIAKLYASDRTHAAVTAMRLGLIS